MYLTNLLLIEGYFSDWNRSIRFNRGVRMKIDDGVPQGSILGST